jgi:metallo-beta-lactamase family protein
MKIRFAGAAQTVTGSQTVLRHGDWSTLIDCGLYQGPKALRLLNWEKPDFFSAVSSIVITHAHIDHSGLLPRWALWGWRGPIFCTETTAQLLRIMLIDSARLQEEDARFANVTKHSRHDPALPLYTENDARRALELLHPIAFDQWQPLSPLVSFRFLRAGHILGSAIVQVAYTNSSHTRFLTFSGDLGGGHSELLKEPQAVIETDDLVLESTYGDRSVLAEGRESRLADIINKVLGRKGTLVIPAFALGRTQDLLLSMFRLQATGRIPPAPIYLDSPMANAVTKIYLDNLDELKQAPGSRELDLALSSRFFHRVEDSDSSMLLCMSDEPKIVISASGMLQGGRVLHHLKSKLPDKNSGVLFVGFQGSETKGRLLSEGLPKIRIHHKEITVEAEIFRLDGYSAHGDADDLMRWIRQFKRGPTRIFLNHGEPESQRVFADRLRRELGTDVEIPTLHREYDLALGPTASKPV